MERYPRARQNIDQRSQHGRWLEDEELRANQTGSSQQAWEAGHSHYAHGSGPSSREPSTRHYPSSKEPSARHYPSSEEPSARHYPSSEEPSARQYPSSEEPSARHYPSSARHYPSSEEPSARPYPSSARHHPSSEEPSARHYPSSARHPSSEEPSARHYPSSEEPSARHYPSSARHYPSSEEPSARHHPSSEEPSARHHPSSEEPSTRHYPSSARHHPYATSHPQQEHSSGRHLGYVNSQYGHSEEMASETSHSHVYGTHPSYRAGASSGSSSDFLAPAENVRQDYLTNVKLPEGYAKPEEDYLDDADYRHSRQSVENVVQGSLKQEDDAIIKEEAYSKSTEEEIPYFEEDSKFNADDGSGSDGGSDPGVYLGNNPGDVDEHADDSGSEDEGDFLGDAPDNVGLDQQQQPSTSSTLITPTPGTRKEQIDAEIDTLIKKRNDMIDQYTKLVNMNCMNDVEKLPGEGFLCMKTNCCTVFANLGDFLSHLHGLEHMAGKKKYLERIWPTKCELERKDDDETFVKRNLGAVVPWDAYYCTLCSHLEPSVKHIKSHLQSPEHQSNFQEHCKNQAPLTDDEKVARQAKVIDMVKSVKLTNESQKKFLHKMLPANMQKGAKNPANMNYDQKTVQEKMSSVEKVISTCEAALNQME